MKRQQDPKSGDFSDEKITVSEYPDPVAVTEGANGGFLHGPFEGRLISLELTSSASTDREAIWQRGVTDHATCIVELAMLVMGIMALVKGEVKLSRRKVVRGPAARILGVILITPFPIAFMFGVVIGIRAAATGQPQPDMVMLLVVELCIIGAVGVLAVVFALATAQIPRKLPRQPVADTFDANTNFPPPDPNNPYASPYASGQQPPPNPFRDLDP